MLGTEGPTVLEPLREGLRTPDAAPVSGSASCALPPRYEAVSSARNFTRSTLRHWDLTEKFDDVALVVSELVTNAMRHGLTPGADHGAASGDEGDPPVRLHLMRWSARLVCAVRDPSDQPPDVTAVRDTAAHRGAHGGCDDRGTPAGLYDRSARANSMEYGGSMDRGGASASGAPLEPGRPLGSEGPPGHGGNGGHGGHGGAVEAADAFAASDASGVSYSEDAEYGTPGFTAESGRGLCLVDSFSDAWGWHPLSGPLTGKIVWALFRTGREAPAPGFPALGEAPALGGVPAVSGLSGRRTHRP